MRVCEKEHKYELSNILDDTAQTVEFFHKGQNGTTNEEVLNMLIERLYNQQETAYSEHNKKILSHLKAARKEFIIRYQEKLKRKYGDENITKNSTEKRVHGETIVGFKRGIQSE